MEVRLKANHSPLPTPNAIYVDACSLTSRRTVEELIAFLKINADKLWPEEKTDAK